MGQKSPSGQVEVASSAVMAVVEQEAVASSASVDVHGMQSISSVLCVKELYVPAGHSSAVVLPTSQ